MTAITNSNSILTQVWNNARLLSYQCCTMAWSCLDQLRVPTSPLARPRCHHTKFKEVQRRDWRLFRKNLISRYGEGSTKSRWGEGRWAHEIGVVEPVSPFSLGTVFLFYHPPLTFTTNPCAPLLFSLCRVQEREKFGSFENQLGT